MCKLEALLGYRVNLGSPQEQPQMPSDKKQERQLLSRSVPIPQTLFASLNRNQYLALGKLFNAQVLLVDSEATQTVSAWHCTELNVDTILFRSSSAPLPIWDRPMSSDCILSLHPGSQRLTFEPLFSCPVPHFLLLGWECRHRFDSLYNVSWGIYFSFNFSFVMLLGFFLLL